MVSNPAVPRCSIATIRTLRAWRVAPQRAGVARVVSFGEAEGSDCRLIKCALQPESSTVEADILGTRIDYKIGAPGRHQVLNSLAVLGAASLARG